MKFLNGWIDIPDEDMMKQRDDDFIICKYCSANPYKCGEQSECCDKAVQKEYKGRMNISRAIRQQWETKIMSFETDKEIKLEDLE